MRQHGNYWVWHDYIRRKHNFNGNKSITLTTHATYMDLGLLPTLLDRWQAPISLSIYACGSDFDKTIQSLSYLIYCLKQGDLMRRFLSVHLVIDSENIPENLKRFGISFITPPYTCARSAPFEKMRQDLTFWNKKKLTYPVNLLRNVARYNAETYYIMALDLQLVPPPNFVKKFLKFVQTYYILKSYISSPYTSVYCLPTFAHKPHAPLAQTKNQLIQVLKEYSITNPIYNHYELQNEWLSTQNSKDDLRIFSSSSKMNMCVGYISINELEPLYDERCDVESIYDRGANLKAKVLVGLNYTFLILDGAFIIRHSLDSWKSIDLVRMQHKTILKFWLTWYKFYNNFLSLEPEAKRDNLNV
ncbi:beta-1,4-glucuronyltransferase 1-like [Drosophila innubila]|uniref:beta-1,4-glucuronyltransferase 1-like n=1 Tax=Drosophila innubila TaxID=198719 RepID=UPI00148B82B7|nr:beta-1,4-glucuronyltransferase 1-like [Drosophila innubila]